MTIQLLARSSQPSIRPTCGVRAWRYPRVGAGARWVGGRAAPLMPGGGGEAGWGAHTLPGRAAASSASGVGASGNPVLHLPHAGQSEDEEGEDPADEGGGVPGLGAEGGVGAAGLAGCCGGPGGRRPGLVPHRLGHVVHAGAGGDCRAGRRGAGNPVDPVERGLNQTGPPGLVARAIWRPPWCVAGQKAKHDHALPAPVVARWRRGRLLTVQPRGRATRGPSACQVVRKHGCSRQHGVPQAAHAPGARSVSRRRRSNSSWRSRGCKRVAMTVRLRWVAVQCWAGHLRLPRTCEKRGPVKKVAVSE